MSREQYFNKATYMYKNGASYMEFLDIYPPRSKEVSADRLGRRLAKIFQCPKSTNAIKLYLTLQFNLDE